MLENKEIVDEQNLRNHIQTDFDSCYFIEAGAGAGKTALVVDRITEQLKSGQYLPREIVAITFTNKAAQELSERIGTNLRRALNNNRENSVLAEAVKHIGEMQISTIHSFCNRLLRENCFQAKMRMDFELLEEENAQEFKSAFFDQWFKKNSQAYQAICTELKQLDLTLTYHILFKNFCNICELPDNLKFYWDDGITLQEMQDAQNKYAQEVKTFVEHYKNTVDQCVGTLATNDNPFHGQSYADNSIEWGLKNAYKSDTDDETFFNAVSKDWCPIKRNAKGVSKFPTFADELSASVAGPLETELNALVALKDQVTNQYPNAFKHARIMSFLLQARDDYRKNPSSRYITQDRILQKANELLDDPAVCQKYQKLFKCVYVDEFQDTDPIQNEMIRKLCSKDNHLINGMLFLVGDVKQSIYRFREADYRLFEKTKKEFLSDPNSCKVVSLKINNRSNEELVEYYNDHGGRIIPSYQNMMPRHEKRTEDTVLHGVYKAKEDVDNESAYLADIIKSLVGKADIYGENEDTNKKDRVVRKVCYKDIMILTAKAKDSSEYIDALHAHGIPAKVALEYTPGEMKALRRFVLLYRYFATPNYKRFQEGALEVSQGDTSFQINDNLPQMKAEREKIKNMTGAQLVGYLLAHPQWYLYEEHPQKGCDLKCAQMAIRQMTESVLSSCDDNPATIADCLAEYMDDSYVCDREVSAGRDEDAVQLLNQHKAKGMQSPIVIIAQRNKINEKDTNYTEGNLRYQCIQLDSTKTIPPYARLDKIRKTAEDERNKENNRLEYVAVTRAEEALIFMGSIAKDNDVPKFSNYVHEDTKKLEDYFEITPDNYSEVSTPKTKLTSIQSGDDTGTEKQEYRISPSLLEIKIARKMPEEPEILDKPMDEDGNTEELPSVFRGDADDDIEITSESSELMQKRPSGDLFGTVMHRAFELAVHGIKKNNLNINYCISLALNENADDIESRYKDKADKQKNDFQQYLEKMLPAFVEAIRQDISQSSEIYTEYPFSLMVTGKELDSLKKEVTGFKEGLLPKDNGKCLFLSGKADLIIQTGDDIVIWDYKSDTKAADENEEDFIRRIHQKYDNQMNVYCWVMAKNFKGTIEGKFYSAEIGVVPSISK